MFLQSSIWLYKDPPPFEFSKHLSEIHQELVQSEPQILSPNRSRHDNLALLLKKNTQQKEKGISFCWVMMVLLWNLGGFGFDLHNK